MYLKDVVRTTQFIPNIKFIRCRAAPSNKLKTCLLHKFASHRGGYIKVNVSTIKIHIPYTEVKHGHSPNDYARRRAGATDYIFDELVRCQITRYKHHITHANEWSLECLPMKQKQVPQTILPLHHKLK